jgi:putative colanic acid biosynthesis glycosyltransferase
VTNLKEILSINVRLTEGGAAQVMLSIHQQLLKLGISSNVGYGYGPHGGVSPQESEYSAQRLTGKFRMATNFITHQSVGIDLVSPSAKDIKRFREILNRADVLHLHAVHSYFWNFEELLEVISESETPVVWTMHDSWLLTGRCAIPGNCKKWLEGCGKCPSKSTYPPTKIDLSKQQWKSKRDALRRLRETNKLVLVSVSDWLARDLELAGFEDVRVIRNGSDIDFWEASNHLNQASTAARKGMVFINRDLRDRSKVSLQTLNRLAEAGVDLTVVGNNPPEGLSKKIELIPATSNRFELAQIMSRHETLLFTSKTDNFPLTVVEALISGMSVRLPQGDVANEFSHFPQVVPFADEIELITTPIPESVKFNLNFDEFQPEQMALHYLDLYRSLV